jgi:hypothetical protein
VCCIFFKITPSADDSGYPLKLVFSAREKFFSVSLLFLSIQLLLSGCYVVVVVVVVVVVINTSAANVICRTPTFSKNIVFLSLTLFVLLMTNYFNVPSVHFLPSLLGLTKSRDSAVGIALGYGLDDRGSSVRFPAGARNFSLHHGVLNGSGAHPASYPMGTRGSFPGGKAAGA